MSMARLIVCSTVIVVCASAATVNVTVPGTSDPWLAGMPAGSTASTTDTAPAQSPVLVPLALAAGTVLTFSTTGGVTNTPGCNPVTLAGCNSPDGGALTPHLAGAENGIANVTAPLNSLVGAFLDINQPNLSAAPGALDFGAIGLNFTTLAPGLKRVFFIGDGLTSTAVRQQFAVPSGATRLFLGTMDGFEWSNNTGQFSVTVSDIPEPTSWLSMAAGLLIIALRRSDRASA